MHYDLGELGTTCNEPHSSSTLARLSPAPLSLVSSSAENTSLQLEPFVTLAFVRGSGLAC